VLGAGVPCVGALPSAFLITYCSVFVLTSGQTKLDLLRTGQIHEIHAAVTGSASQVATKFVSLDCPAPSPYFTGRSATLASLHRHFSLEGRAIATLVTHGGAGKTQAALRFAETFRCVSRL
jgi:hypothetical protein